MSHGPWMALLRKRCDEIGDPRAPGYLSRLEQTACGVARMPTIVSTLAEISSDNALLRTIAAESYRHINGFDKLVLVKSEADAYAVRLHIWWRPTLARPAKAALSRLHNHRWAFASAILLGQFVHERYEVQADDAGLPMHVYERRRSEEAEGTALMARGVTTVRRVGGRTYTSGMSYVLTPSIFHNVKVNSEPCGATVVVRGGATAAHSLVLTKLPLRSSADMAGRRAFTGGEVRMRLLRLLEMLERNALQPTRR